MLTNSRGGGRESALVVVCGLGLLLAYWAIFHRYFPTSRGTLGHDYSQFLPQLLNGVYWHHQNGIFSIPWFTPAFCGGLPFFANPQNMYFSLPQFLAFFVDPLKAVQLTVMISAGAGFFGAYFLMRQAFSMRIGSALFGATVFLFNGFFSSRMLVGHFTFHSFMLVPCIAFWLIRPLPLDRGLRPWRAASDCALAGLSMAYVIYSGGMHLVLPMAIAIAAICLLGTLVCCPPSNVGARLSGAVLAALAICSLKALAGWSFLHNFPRSGYPLSGIPSVTAGVRLLLSTLFGRTPPETANDMFVNSRWIFDRHEFEYGVTAVPAVALLVWAASGLSSLVKGGDHRAIPARHLSGLLVVLLVLCAPLALNYYGPAWNGLLKRTPLIGSSSTLIRAFAAYVPVVALLAAMALDRMRLSATTRPIVCAGAILAVVLAQASTDRGYYQDQSYSPELITRAWHTLRESGAVPPITHVGFPRSPDGSAILGLNRNDALAQGISALAYYEPIFGYRLENFPLGDLHAGPALDARHEALNVKNPSCFLFPRENGCAPGAHFASVRADAAAGFLAYRSFSFVLPPWAKPLAATGAIAAAACALMPVLCAVIRRRRRREVPSAPRGAA